MSAMAEIPAMVERVAWALMLDEYGPGGRDTMLDYWWGKYADTYRKHARAAIEAMRDPTKEMLNAGTEQAPEGIDDEDGRPSHYQQDAALPIWHAMIDAALRPST